MAVLDDLAARGLIQDSTDLAALRAAMSEGPITLYCGFDPTADSLHVGNLQALLLLRRFQEAGHRPIALAGGATGRIGDPSGRDSERPLLSDSEIDHNLERIRTQFGRFVRLDGEPETAGIVVDNREWTEPLSIIDFLRDVGKFQTVNQMLARDSVKNRIDRENGISFTEFTYQLLQANDFRALFDTYGCVLQVAGSDQWGNITAGIDLTRRTRGVALHGMTAALLADASGRKIGKSTGGGSVWLDATKTSPYQLFQHFMDVSDDSVETMLLRLTMLPVDECRDIAANHRDSPGLRTGQRRLSREIVALIHGAEAADAAAAATEVLFSPQGLGTDNADALAVLADEIPTMALSPEGLGGGIRFGDLARDGGLVKSLGELRRNPGGLKSARGVVAPDDHVTADDFVGGRHMLLKWGKSAYLLVVLGASAGPNHPV